MSDLRDAARQALEALETVFMPHHPAVISLRAALAEEALQRLTDVHQEIEAVLEQPEPPPKAQTEAEKIAYCAGWWAAMAAKAKEQPEQEPVAYLYHDASTPHHAHPWLHSTMLVLAADRRPSLRGETPLFTHPPRREWQGLTEEESKDLWISAVKEGRPPRWFAIAIEAALRSKNHE